ncbi:MAG: hypothetical protein LUG16_03650 [Candidatus Gastranaerophilales bacterium]|nr:hypothetical protein [Candidatus Gastranaerophilales bacterium]
MQISLNKSNNYSLSLGKTQNQKDLSENKPLTKEDIWESKTKKIVSQASCLAIGAGIVYFSIKRNFKNERINKHFDMIENALKAKVPKGDAKAREISAIDVMGLREFLQ